ncbi:hypothetical protein LEP1GSC151_3685 [Leptospira interrogans serovar Grippotyphosa str. LT2186]|uniref:Uncharacterized protein n=1 Tax=Leptospira interrogans serovar Grippotyphosa str. LT2186 TaxID=1001599 RepID=M3HI29_LEPIR|nr:hypothetical protein LEP1GSC151_3685 [Leptospira interrogans serovar Grippotyphosa str. LT2186]
MLKKNNQSSGKTEKQERSRVSSWPFLFLRKKFQNIRPTNNGFTISQRKARYQRLGFLRLEALERQEGSKKLDSYVFSIYFSFQ